MIGWSRLIELMFLIITAWQDIWTKSISVWVYIVFGISALLLRFDRETVSWHSLTGVCISMGVGLFLYVVYKVTEGAIGEGDCLFFLVTGIFFNLWDNIFLLLLGLLLCSIYSLGLVVWGAFWHVNVRMKRLPFLPFLLLPGIWLVFV